jgi:Carboxypeptidase regulatory-like domain
MGIKTFIRPMFLALLLTFLTSPSLGLDSSYDWQSTPLLRGYGILTTPDWLNPYNAGRPEWDPFGPGAYPGLIPQYNGAYGFVLQMEQADPFRNGLQLKESVQSPNKLYLQQGSVLTTRGSVDLAKPYIIWANVANWGSFTLYDHDHPIISKGNLAPGWYRITGPYSEALGDHQYRFVSLGRPSNNLSVLVSPAGYPTSLSLAGQVVDPSGIGIGGVRVIISDNEGGTFTVSTNGLGYYGIDVPSGIYSITAQLSGYQFTRSSARVWPGAVSAARKIIGYPTFVAGAGYFAPTASSSDFPNVAAEYAGGLGLLQGRIADQSGRPIASVEIKVDTAHTNVFTNSSGGYQISINPGMHRIQAEKDGYGIMPRAVQVQRG